MLNPWQWVCYVLAIPIVYVFGNDICAAVGLVIDVVSKAVGEHGTALIDSVAPWKIPDPSFKQILIGIGVGIPVALLGIIVLVPLMIIGWIVQWLVTSSGGVVHFIADAGLVWVVGMLLCGIVFPILWTVMAPLLAATVGEIVAERVGAQVYGEPVHITRPLYLLVGLISLAFGVARLAMPEIQRERTAFQAAVQQEYFPPTPGPVTPPAWPKYFTLAPKQLVHTGVFLTDKNQEIFFWTTAHMSFKIGEDGAWTFFRKNAGDNTTEAFSQARTGEVLLQGGDEAAKVTVGQPQFRNHHWLAPGETVNVGQWVEAGSTLWYCGEGELFVRTVQRGRPSSQWGSIANRTPCEAGYGSIGHSPPQGEEAPGSGMLEVKAGRRASWFNFLSAWPPEHWVDVPAGRVVATDVPVRRGDRVRIKAGEALYFLEGDHEVLVPSGQVRDEVSATSGVVRLKGGVAKSRAAVTVLARGPEWK